MKRKHLQPPSQSDTLCPVIGMARIYTREYFQRMGRKGGKRVDPQKRAAATKKRIEDRLRQWCAEAGHDYDKLPTDDETGKRLLPDVVKDKYIEWRYGWKPGKRKKTTNHKRKTTNHEQRNRNRHS